MPILPGQWITFNLNLFWQEHVNQGEQGQPVFFLQRSGVRSCVTFAACSLHDRDQSS